MREVRLEGLGALIQYFCNCRHPSLDRRGPSRAPEIAKRVTEGIESEIAEGKMNPYDTHAPLHDRIAAIERLRIGAAGENSQPALSLLSVPDTVELQFLKFINPKLEKNTLRRVGWDVLGTMATIPTWKTAVAAYGSFLQGLPRKLFPK